MHPDRVKQGILDVRQYFETHGTGRYRTLLTFILGLPGETLTDLEDTRKWLLANWQGQSWTPFVLEIPSGELNRKSKMSMDYAKYGYSEFAGTHKDLEYTQARVSNELLIWQNKDMDYFKAYDVFFSMISDRNSADNEFRLAPWDLAAIGLPDNIDDKLSLHVSALNDQTVRLARTQFIDSYINKKLSL